MKAEVKWAAPTYTVELTEDEAKAVVAIMANAQWSVDEGASQEIADVAQSLHYALQQHLGVENTNDGDVRMAASGVELFNIVGYQP